MASEKPYVMIVEFEVGRDVSRGKYNRTYKRLYYKGGNTFTNKHYEAKQYTQRWQHVHDLRNINYPHKVVNVLFEEYRPRYRKW
jgi:hypothetical protein